jgi:DNA-binding CsgD family transcriptional regulator
VEGHVDTVTLEGRARELARRELDLEATCLAFDDLLRRVVPYAAAAWSTHDPATGLFTSCTVSGLPEDASREARFFAYEFRDDEPSTFGSLIAERRAVAVLSDETAGELERAARYREFLRDLGCTDELRAVLWDEDRPWGSVVLYAAGGRFGSADAERVATLAPHAARGLRLVLLRDASSQPALVRDPPGVVEVRDGGEVVATTEPARRWLELGGSALVTAANAVAAAVRGNRDWPGATARLSLPGGRVLTLHGSRSTIGDRVAVIVDAARPAEVASMLVDAYGLTVRQREVLGLLLLGRSIAQLARQLGISEHTANDHRKAIYTRLGVGSRSELAAKLQAEQYTPRQAQGRRPSPYGGFLDG